MKVNHDALQLKNNYLFSEVARRIRTFQAQNPEKKLLKCSIGDVTRPLPEIIVNALKSASEEMAHAETFRGYGAEQGEAFLRKAIAGYYQKRNISISEEDVFISDGAKSDLGSLCDLFDKENTVLLPNPVYPVYYDTNVMAGRKIQFLNGSQENHFLPMPEEHIPADIIYLCSPNNPTGAVYSREQLRTWVDYALENKAVLLFDAAYESYIQDEELPHSIFEIEGAERCAVEINSLSKMAGFTGVRCGWTVVPSSLILDEASLHDMWFRRMSTKYNGTSYIIQRAAEAVFTEEGQKAVHEDIAYYMENARILKHALNQAGFWTTGGENAPYIWVQAKNAVPSWEFFDYLLNTYGIAGTPGAGFGAAGEGYLRFSSFGTREVTEQAAEILSTL